MTILNRIKLQLIIWVYRWSYDVQVLECRGSHQPPVITIRIVDPDTRETVKLIPL